MYEAGKLVRIAEWQQPPAFDDGSDNSRIQADRAQHGWLSGIYVDGVHAAEDRQAVGQAGSRDQSSLSVAVVATVIQFGRHSPDQ